MSNNSVNPLDREKKVTDIVTIKDLLSSDRVFRVPDYQRGYSWNNEFIVLWKDILHLYKTKTKKHYTGMLALEEITDNVALIQEAVMGTTAFYIVDGQQRMASLVIIIKSLISYIAEELPGQDLSKYNDCMSVNQMYRFGYSATRQDGSNKYFEERVFNNNKLLKHEDHYLSNINFAKEYIDKELHKLNGKTALEILDVIIDRIVFNIYFVTDDFDVRVTFETINNRGKRLSKLELLKNRLMYLSTFFESDSNRFDLRLKSSINEAWKEIFQNLCYGDDQLPDDEYLRAHWLAYGKMDKTIRDTYIDDLLNKEFAVDSGKFYSLISSGEYQDAYNYINNYVTSLSKYSYYWALVRKPEQVQSNLNYDELYWVKRISRCFSNIYLNTAMMVVVADNACESAEKTRLYETLERFVFVNKLIAQNKNDLSFLVTAVKPLMNNTTSNSNPIIKSIISDINKHELSVNGKRIVDAINVFVIEILEKKTHYYYSWNGLSYFLFEYNDSFNSNTKKLAWYDLSSTSIEHVLPQTPKTDYWNTAFENYTEEELNALTNSLGNLLLLSSGSENSTLGNCSFPVKKDMPVASGKFSYSSGSPSAQEIAHNDYWTVNEIYKRSDRLVEFLYEHWFAAVSDLDKKDWDNCKSLLLKDLPKPLDQKETKKLYKRLKAINTDGERKNVEKVLTGKPSNIGFYRKQLLEYIDTDIVHVKYNSSNVSYKPYISIVLKLKNDELNMLRCGVRIDITDYLLEYSYENNELGICYWDEGVSHYIMDANSLPEMLKIFVLSINRYLRRAIGQGKPPLWVDRNAKS